MRKGNEYYMVDEPLAEYRILNMDETMREEVEYEMPYLAEFSGEFDDWPSANMHIQYLEDLKRDPSYTVAIFGYHVERDSIRIVHYVRASYT